MPLRIFVTAVFVVVACGDAAAGPDTDGVPHDKGDYAAILDELRPSAEHGKAAEQGYAPAQLNLGHMHQSGEGVPGDHVESFAWYDLAAAQDCYDAWERRETLLNLMTPDQVTAAQEFSSELGARISANWRPSCVSVKPIRQTAVFRTMRWSSVHMRPISNVVISVYLFMNSESSRVGITVST